MKSFSNLVKEEISKIADKQKLCCAFSELYGMMLCANKKDDKIIFFISKPQILQGIIY